MAGVIQEFPDTEAESHKTEKKSILPDHVYFHRLTKMFQVDTEFYLSFRFVGKREKTEVPVVGCKMCFATKNDIGNINGYTQGHVLVKFQRTEVTGIEILNTLVKAIGHFNFDDNYIFTAIQKTDLLHPEDRLPIYVASQE
jgi:hypothetical protein